MKSFCIALLLNALATSLWAAEHKPPPPKKLIFLHFYLSAKEQPTKADTFKWVETSSGEAIHNSIKDKYNYVKSKDRVWQEYIKKNKIDHKQT